MLWEAGGGLWHRSSRVIPGPTAWLRELRRVAARGARPSACVNGWGIGRKVAVPWLLAWRDGDEWNSVYQLGLPGAAAAQNPIDVAQTGGGLFDFYTTKSGDGRPKEDVAL